MTTEIENNPWEDEIDEKPVEAVTIAELSAACEQMYALKDEMKALEAAVKEKQSAYSDIERRVLATFEAHNLSNFECTSGKVIRSNRVSVKQPASPEAKAAFFEYLRSKGIFEEMVSVNSKTLAAYVKREIDQAELDGNMGFVPPGLERPTRFEFVALRKK
jgi:hypothetical protein